MEVSVNPGSHPELHTFLSQVDMLGLIIFVITNFNYTRINPLLVM